MKLLISTITSEISPIVLVQLMRNIRVQCPCYSGSLYYNYKQYFSILLQAVVDADCKIILVDIGAERRQKF